MSTITWESASRCNPALGLIHSESGETLLIQTDWDAPPVARTFGWDMRTVQMVPTGAYGARYPDARYRCEHRGTDGTIDCPECRCSAHAFISEAIEYLKDNDGATAEDPGYFNNEK